jgi:Iap family predicted aminopeptidase
MILGADAKDVITVGIERKMKRKMKQLKGNGLPGRDTIVIVSHRKEKVYRVLFRKSIRLDNLDSVAFRYIKLAELLHLSIFVINLCKFISQM